MGYLETDAGKLQLAALLEVAFVISIGFVIAWLPYDAVREKPVVFSICAMLILLAFKRHRSFEKLGLTLSFWQIRSSQWLWKVTLVIVCLVFFFGWWNETIHIKVNTPLGWSISFGLYLVWTLLQQYLLQVCIFTNLQMVADDTLAIIFANGLFALIHLPNPLLVVVCFLGGLLLSYEFLRSRSIVITGFFQCLIGFSLAHFLPSTVTIDMRIGYGGYQKLLELYPEVLVFLHKIGL